MLLAVVVSAASCVEQVPELDPASVFEGVEGYEFAPLPPTIAETVRDEYRVNPALADRVRQVELRTAQDQGGRGLGVVMVLAVDPDLVGDPDFDREVAQGFSAEADSPMQEIRVAGHRVFEGTPVGALGGRHVLIWREANLVVVLLGDRPRDDLAVAEAMIGREPRAEA